MARYIRVLANGDVKSPHEFLELDAAPEAAGDPGYLNPAKGRWAVFVDERPDFDARWQDLVRTMPANVPSGPVEVGYAVVDRPAETVLAERLQQLEADRYARETGGMTINGITISTDRDSVQLIDSLQGTLRDEIISSVRFKSAGGQIIAGDLALVNLLRQQLTLFHQALRNNEADHIEAMSAILEDEEIENKAEAIGTHDAGTGWASKVVTVP